jgi:hypothetical protein
MNGYNGRLLTKLGRLTTIAIKMHDTVVAMVSATFLASGLKWGHLICKED